MAESHQRPYTAIAAKAERDYAISGSSRTRIAAETICDRLKVYRRGGLEAIMPTSRADRGRMRGLPPSEVKASLAAKEANHHHSPQRNLGHISRVHALVDWYRKQPELFVVDPGNLPGPDT